jgi:hypothetical protein
MSVVGEWAGLLPAYLVPSNYQYRLHNDVRVKQSELESWQILFWQFHLRFI